MELRSVDKYSYNLSRAPKQAVIRKLLDEFKLSSMEVAEIERWQDVSKRHDSFRQLVNHQILYRNGNKYNGIKIVQRSFEGEIHFFLVKEVINNA